MRRVLAILIDLACGLALVAVLFLGVRILLQSRSLVVLLLPLLAVTAIGLGAWRGRARALPPWLSVALLNLPTALLVAYTAGRATQLWLLPLLGLAFAAVGTAAARLRAASPTSAAAAPLPARSRSLSDLTPLVRLSRSSGFSAFSQPWDRRSPSPSSPATRCANPPCRSSSPCQPALRSPPPICGAASW